MLVAFILATNRLCFTNFVLFFFLGGALQIVKCHATLTNLFRFLSLSLSHFSILKRKKKSKSTSHFKTLSAKRTNVWLLNDNFDGILTAKQTLSTTQRTIQQTSLDNLRRYCHPQCVEPRSQSPIANTNANLNANINAYTSADINSNKATTTTTYTVANPRASSQIVVLVVESAGADAPIIGPTPIVGGVSASISMPRFDSFERAVALDQLKRCCK